MSVSDVMSGRDLIRRAVACANEKECDAEEVSALIRQAAEAGNPSAAKILSRAGDGGSSAQILACLLVAIACTELARRRKQDRNDDDCYSMAPARGKERSWLTEKMPEGAEVPSPAGRAESHTPNIKRTNPSFAALLIRHVQERFNGDAPAVYRAAHINRKTYSSIVSNEVRPVSKRTAVAFAFGLGLPRQSVDELLRSAGYALSEALLEDIVYAACIDAGIYDLVRVNKILVAHRVQPFTL